MMKKALYLGILIFWCLGFSLLANSPVDSIKSALPYKVKLKYADALFDAGNYYEAIDYYKELSEEKPAGHYANFRIAESYRHARDYVQAENWYQKVIDNGGDAEFPLAYYYFAQMQKMNGKYEDAKYSFARFSLRASGNSKLAQYEARATKEIEACDFGIHSQDTKGDFEVSALDSVINMPYSDYAPFSNGGLLYFSSFNRDSLLQTNVTGDFKSHLYRTLLKKDEKTVLEKLPPPVNSDQFHSGNCAFNPAGNRMYFTECSDFGEANIQCKIFFSAYADGSWGEPVELNQEVNKPKSNNTQPAVAPSDGESDLLYFASDRAGGKGGYDIWYSEIDAQGNASAAVNLGDKINTDEDEKTPFYYKGKLFFSSCGHIGLGGLDIFRSSGRKESWTNPENLGVPVNSSADDMYFTKANEPRQYYFVSNRVGINGNKSETCCDDIFIAKDLREPKFFVKGSVYEKSDSLKKEPLTGTKAEIFEIKDNQQRSLVTEDLLVGESNYMYNLNWGKKYEVKFSKKGYFSEIFSVSTQGGESDTFFHNVSLGKLEKNKSYRLENIYYGSGETSLKPESKATLDILYELLMDNPKIVIELSSHTDSVGTDNFNLDLSQKRAQRCVDYLISLGVSATRLIPKGYGESQPVAPNSNRDGTDYEQGRQLNRRTEFKIIGELSRKGDKIIYD